MFDLHIEKKRDGGRRGGGREGEEDGRDSNFYLVPRRNLIALCPNYCLLAKNSKNFRNVPNPSFWFVHDSPSRCTLPPWSAQMNLALSLGDLLWPGFRDSVQWDVREEEVLTTAEGPV